jgi:4-hydroxy-tetrahydrodipicolinate synthase
MYLAGLIDTLEYRLPLTAPTKSSMELLKKTLAKYDIVK